MSYGIYFDESIKLDQPIGNYAYYGALGINFPTKDKLVKGIQQINKGLTTKSELHFVDYTSDTYFEKYFKILNYALEQEISINLMIIDKKSARQIANQMNISLTQLRELFYVKIPERLFYGLTRHLEYQRHVHITIDKNSEYEKIRLETKLAEQMNAHSAYRNKGYKIEMVKQACSQESIPLQLIDVFMGIIIFLLEGRYNGLNRSNSISRLVKNDLIYRFLIHNDNLKKLHRKIVLYRWNGGNDEIERINLSDFTGRFIIHKTQFDIKEMNRLSKFINERPGEDTKYYRKKMGYTTRQLKTIQGYMAELNGEGRNSYYIK